MPHPFWPIYDVVVRTPRLELRLPNENELAELIKVADRTIYRQPDVVPFITDWPSRPSPERERGFVQYAWKARAEWTPDAWSLVMSPFIDGRPVGSQVLRSHQFRELRQVGTGSWLAREAQGQGLGTEMRSAILHLAFEGLGADEAISEARVDNDSSANVSTKLGYESVGTRLNMFGGQRAPESIFKLTRERWLETRRDDIEIIGLDSCRDMFISGD